MMMEPLFRCIFLKKKPDAVREVVYASDYNPGSNGL